MSKWQLPPTGGHMDRRTGIYLQTMTMRDSEERLAVNDVLFVPTDHASNALDEALEYVAQDSPAAARQLLIDCLASAESLATLSERGRAVPEVNGMTELFASEERSIMRCCSSRK